MQKLVQLPGRQRPLADRIARYLTPDGEAIQGKGLEPDVDVDEPDVEFGSTAPADSDPILDAALERLRQEGRVAAAQSAAD